MVCDEWESCRILLGVPVLTQHRAAPQTFRADDSCILRPGFAGTWHVLETTLKEHVIRV